MGTATTTLQFFDDKYRQNPDPWDFASSAYELSRYAAILQALAGRRYRRAFEPGCSIGVLTAGLAPHCDELHAMDLSPTAADLARERCRALPQIYVTCGRLPDQMPTGDFDLIVLSEIGYYFEAGRLLEVARTLVEHLSIGGTLLAAHWLGKSPDHLMSGDEVHACIASIAGLEHRHAERQAGFRLDRWIRTAA